MSVGLVVLEFKIPCTPDDDPRDRIQRALRSALKLLADVSPAQALPVEVYCEAESAILRCTQLNTIRESLHRRAKTPLPVSQPFK